MSTRPDPVAVAEEARRARELRTVVDLACAVLRQGGLDRREGEELVAATKRRALELFPDKEGVFDLVLAPRFRRILDECVPPKGARILRFPGARDPRS